MVFPVVLGGGKRLFADGAVASGFTLAESAVTGAGVVYQVLRPAPLVVGFVGVEDGHEATP